MRRTIFFLVPLLTLMGSVTFAQESQTARPEVGQPVAQAGSSC